MKLLLKEFPPIDEKTLGAFLRRVRQDSGLTQRWVAQNLKISDMFVSMMNLAGEKSQLKGRRRI